VQLRQWVNGYAFSVIYPKFVVEIGTESFKQSLHPRFCIGYQAPFLAILKKLGKDLQIRFL
jgi:hypothetical protein